MLSAILTIVPLTLAIAQGAQLNVPKEFVTESPGEASLGITVGPADALPRNSYLRIRGLPPSVALSQGHSIAPGSWAVPLSALPGLKLMVPTGVFGRSDVAVVLMSVDGAIQAEARAVLVATPKVAASAAPPPPVARATTTSDLRAGIASSAEAAPMVPPAPVAAMRSPIAVAPVASIPMAPAPAAPTPVAPGPSPEERQRLMRLVQKGDSELTDGGIAGARLMYQRAADAGLAQGALALGGTYDPVELARARVVGFKPDPVQAKRWYERARDLGSPEAAERLKRLGVQ